MDLKYLFLRLKKFKIFFFKSAPSHLNKSINCVDKSLDEALQHIDKLKEDMNHLCNDIDSLYKAKHLNSINSISLRNNLQLINRNLNVDHFALSSDSNTSDSLKNNLTEYNSYEFDSENKNNSIYLEEANNENTKLTLKNKIVLLENIP